MASQKVRASKVIGNMTVVTMSVDTQELYVTIVLRGESLWDITASTDVETAKIAHENYVTMCHAFDAPAQKAAKDEAAGITVDVDAFINEVRNNYSLAVASKKGMMH